MKQLIARFLLAAAIVLTMHAPVSAHAANACEAAFARRLTPQERTQSAEVIVLKLGPGRVVELKYVAPAESSQPTFLLLPGMNRAMLPTDDGVQALIQRGFGIASLTLSVQPESIAHLEGVAPYFLSYQPSLQDFANEVQIASDFLVKSKGAQNLIPVSLSYSGSITPYLKGFPLVVETAPMTDEAAASPEGVRAREMIQNSQMFNPFFGKALARSMTDAAYDHNWKAQADAMLKLLPNLPEAQRANFIKGYSALSRASEGHSWTKSTFTAQTRRIFILGEDEASPLLKNQLETFKRVLGQHPDSLLVLVKDAKHYIPNSQPGAYAHALAIAASSNVFREGGLMVIVPPTATTAAKVFPLSGKKATDAIDQLIEEIGALK